jgi:hypothetical protein
MKAMGWTEREREREARPRREGISCAGGRQVGMRELGIWQDAATYRRSVTWPANHAGKKVVEEEG